MTTIYSPGSYTKNFSWNESYERLHVAISNGFDRSSGPVSRDHWRRNSAITDQDRQLIPMNFFLYSYPGIEDDFLLVDQLVDVAMDPYSDQFAKLALFAFHLANSGTWRNSKWEDGRVAGWANDFIRETASSGADWKASAFLDTALFKYIEDHVDCEPVTQRKVFTNYRYMLRSAGVLTGDALQPRDLRQRWFLDAVQLFWDRQIFDGDLAVGATVTLMEQALIDREVHKLLRCDKDQCRAFARAAYVEYSDGQGPERLAQISSLRTRGSVAA